LFKYNGHPLIRHQHLNNIPGIPLGHSLIRHQHLNNIPGIPLGHPLIRHQHLNNIPGIPLGHPLIRHQHLNNIPGSIEKQILEMSRWMSDVTEVLQQRLDADVLSGDVPEEFQVCYLDADVLSNP
jgi:hypothetical protein